MSLSKKDQTERIYVKVNPEDSANQNVTFTTSDSKVATVDEKGNVKAVANGTAVITVTTKDGKHSASCEVTVFIEQQVIDELITKINDELTALKDKKESDYTPESWKEYKKALEAATNAAKDEKATKADLEKVLEKHLSQKHRQPINSQRHRQRIKSRKLLQPILKIQLLEQKRR